MTIQAKDGNGTDEFVLGATESVLHVGEPSEAVLSGSGELYIASYVCQHLRSRVGALDHTAYTAIRGCFDVHIGEAAHFLIRGF